MKRKARKFVTLGAVALMMTVSLPIAGQGQPIGVFMSGITASAEETGLRALNTDDTKLMFKLKDFGIEQKSTDSNTEAVDTLTVYATMLSENKGVSQVGSTTADQWDDLDNAIYCIPYIEGKGYTAVVSHVSGGNGNSWSDYYYFDETNKSWKHFYAEGSQNSDNASVLNVQFDDTTLGDFANVIADDVPISIYKNNEDGTQTFIKTVHKYNGDNADVVSIPATDYDKYAWSVEIDYTETYARAESHITGTVTGSWLAVKPYITGKDLSIDTKMYDSAVGAGTTSLSGVVFDFKYPERDKSGHTAYGEDGNPIMHSISKIDHGDAWIIKNADVVQKISAKDLDWGIPVIEDYDATATYFMKIAISKDSEEYLYYRYNPETGWWDFRVNTEEYSSCSVPMTKAEYGNEVGYVKSQLFRKVSADSNDGYQLDIWTEDDFSRGNMGINVYTNRADYTYIVFFDYGKNGGIYYQYAGIDPVPIYAYGKRAEKVFASNIDIPTTARRGDTIVIDGVDKNGDKLHYEKYQEYANDTVRVPVDGEYTVTNTSTGFFNSVTNGVFKYKDVEDENRMNLTEPAIENSYVIKDVDGNIFSEGNLIGEAPMALDNLTVDAGISAKQISQMKKSYYTFSTKSGVVNSLKDKCYIDEGYFVFDTSEKSEIGDITHVYPTSVKGDINQDGVFNISDLVLEQKYLLNTPDKDDVFKAVNFIASDICMDGSSDVFDMVALRQMLIE